MGDNVDMLDWTILGWVMSGMLGFCIGILTERHIKFKGPKS